MDIIEALRFRYATKQFDPSKKIPAEKLQKLKEATLLSPSSYGLQPYQVLHITDKAKREALKPMAWGQSQITDASDFFIFAAKTEMEDGYIADFAAMKEKARGLEGGALDQMKSFIQSKVAEKSAAEIKEWNQKQAYLALGNLLTAAAALGVDACPMEGFVAQDIDAYLDLPAKGLHTTVLVTLGYRHPEDKYQHAPKARKPLEELFVEI